MEFKKTSIEIEIVATGASLAASSSDTAEGGRPVVACCCCAKVSSIRVKEQRPVPMCGWGH